MKPLPFFANPDETHCFQAAMKMILKYFLSSQDFSFEKLEKMSAKIKGLSTWPQQMLINLHKMGFEILAVESFDAQSFIREGANYLRRAFGSETADWQIANSNIEQEQKLYKNILMLKEVKYEFRTPTLEEMRRLLAKGYLLNAVVNAQKLNNKKGYIGHSIVIFKIDGQGVTFHDPGPSAQEGRRVSLEDFEAAWSFPNEAAKNFIALRLNNYEEAV